MWPSLVTQTNQVIKHINEMQQLVDWYDKNPLGLNASETKEMVINFKTKACDIFHPAIKGEQTECVNL